MMNKQVDFSGTQTSVCVCGGVGVGGGVCWLRSGGSWKWVGREERAARFSIRLTVKVRWPCLMCNQPPGWKTKAKAIPSARSDKAGGVSVCLHFHSFPRTSEPCLARNERKWQARKKRCTLSFSTTTPSAFGLLTFSQLFRSFAFPYMSWMLSDVWQTGLAFSLWVKLSGSS